MRPLFFTRLLNRYHIKYFLKTKWRDNLRSNTKILDALEQQQVL